MFWRWRCCAAAAAIHLADRTHAHAPASDLRPLPFHLPWLCPGVFASVLVVALRWELQKGWMINPRSKNPVHQAQNLAVAAASFTPFTVQQMADIDAIHFHPRQAPIHKVCPDPLNLK